MWSGTAGVQFGGDVYRKVRKVEERKGRQGLIIEKEGRKQLRC